MNANAALVALLDGTCRCFIVWLVNFTNIFETVAFQDTHKWLLPFNIMLPTSLVLPTLSKFGHAFYRNSSQSVFQTQAQKSLFKRTCNFRCFVKIYFPMFENGVDFKINTIIFLEYFSKIVLSRYLNNSQSLSLRFAETGYLISVKDLTFNRTEHSRIERGLVD